jgi:hypothetical protein
VAIMTIIAGPWPKFPLVYEINTRIWLNELSVRANRGLFLDQVPNEELERIARLGFQCIWLMGVWTTGPEAIKVARTDPDLLKDYKKALPDLRTDDIIGSPYAVSKYEVSPSLGGRQGLAGLRNKMGRYGLRLMLDFVPNHMSRDHWLIGEQPDVFVQGTDDDLARNPKAFFKSPSGKVIACGRDPYFPAWEDTAQINYAQASGRNVMKGKILDIASQCDGVRCDMAMLILPEILERTWGPKLGANPNRASFWKETIPEVLKQNPNFLFMAEAYWDLEWRLQQEGFNFTYDKTLYDRLRKSDFRGVRQHLQGDKNFEERCARFVENHDEPRAAASFGPGRAQSAAVATFFCPGLKLFYEGQLEGRKVRPPVQLGRRPNEPEDIETAIFYEKILDVLHDPIFQDGNFEVREVQSAGWGDVSNDAVLAMYWTPSARTTLRCVGYLIVVNLTGFRAYGRIPLPQTTFISGKQFVFYDRYDAKRYERDGNELGWPGLYVSLEGHQPHLFEITLKA